MQTIAQILATELAQPVQYVENVIALLDEGSTIPFIARYRKEQHGSMDDTTLRKLEDRLQYLRNLDKRRQEVKSAIDGQGKLTDELAAAIDNAATLAEVEDLYRPYKQKRRTRATVAREKGLEPLALLLLAQEKDCPAPEDAAQAYIDPEKGVETAADALQGANDIIAEIISDDADIRKALRGLLMRQGRLKSVAATEEDSVYRLYYDFEQLLPKLAGHQILAVNRGEKEGFLSVTVLLDRDAALPMLRRAVVKPGSSSMAFLRDVCEDAYDRLIYPSLEREARSTLTESACEGAIGQFALNLKPLLLQPPVKGHVTMGLDPGYAHGCKVAVIDGTGKVLDTTVVYPTYGERQKKGGHRPADGAVPQARRGTYRHRQRHRQPGDGTDDGGNAAGSAGCQLYDRQRGGRVGILRRKAGGGGIPGLRREPALRHLHRPSLAGSAGRAGEDRPQGHWRRAVPARYASQAAGRDAGRRGGGLRQRRGRGREHRQRQPAGVCIRSERHHSQEHRGVPGGQRRLPR